MKTKLLFLLLFLAQFGFSQQNPREILNGQIVTDSISPDNVRIVNRTNNTFAISDALGMFHIYAREKDTLVFSSQSLDSKILVLTEVDFKVKLFRVKLDVFVNALDEVVISPYALTGDLEKDQENIKIAGTPKIDVGTALNTLYEDDEQSSPDNKLMPGYLDTRYMVDFIKIGKMLFKRKKEHKPIEFTSNKIFAEAVQQNLPDSFFRDTLKLDKNEVGLFLSYCENDPKARPLLNPKRKFELIDFLISKNKEYKQSKTRD